MMKQREQLSKTLKPQWVWAIAFGSAIGWGSFVQPAIWMGQGGPLGVIIGFLIGALIMLVIGVSYGFLIEELPVSGGDVAFVYATFGRTHAFICGWALTLAYVCIVALNASALALLAKFLVPGLVEWGYLYSIAGWDVYFGQILVASIALIVFAYMNIRGTTLTGKTQYIFCILLLVGVVLLFVGMILNSETSFSNLQPGFKPGISPWSSIIAIVAIAPWAYVGFASIPQVAEEFDFSPKKAFSLIVFALIFAALEYSVMIMVTALAMPWQELVAQNDLWATGTVVAGKLGNVGLFVLAVSLCMGVFTGLNGFYLSASRVLVAMGRAQFLPKAFANLHSKNNTPYIGIITVCLLCLIAPWFGRSALTWVVNMSSTGIAVVFFYCCFVAYKGFKWSAQSKGNGKTIAPVKKFLSLLGSIFGLGILALLLTPGSPGFLSTPSLVALVVWIVIGIVFYYIRKPVFQKIPKEEMDYMILGKVYETKDDQEKVL